MSRGWTAVIGLIFAAVTGVANDGESLYRRFNDPPHAYFGRTPTDRFTQLKDDLESGRLALDRSSEKAFLRSLLKRLGIPEVSQMLVFSTTSLQLSRITPSNPRALYFSEDLYLGYIPGGRLELAALDPELGAVFYIFDVPREGEALKVERATRCMNCHAGEDTGHVPGLVVKSVLPGPSGGSLDAFRLGQSGHGIPWEERFGGWYLTGAGGWTNHWGNTIGRAVNGVMTRIPNSLEARVNLDRYLTSGSDLLAQAVHEHQVGFVNRTVEAIYRARAALSQVSGAVESLTESDRRMLDEQADALVRYLVFADEPALPPGGIEGDAAFKEAFLQTRRTVGGHSLKDFELKTRLFQNRCSYMIYSPLFGGLPEVIKSRVYRKLAAALDDSGVETGGISPGFEQAEKQRIRTILRGTLSDLPAGW